MSTWLEQGVYRLLRVGRTIDSEEVHWSSEDNEFKAVFDAIAEETAASVAPGGLNVLSASRLRVKVAIFDCGITTSSNAFFNARLASEKFAAEYVARPIEKQTEARQRLDEVKRTLRAPTETAADRRVVDEQEKKVAALQKSKTDNQAKRTTLVAEKRGAAAERQAAITVEIAAIDKSLKEITAAVKAAGSDAAYTEANGRLEGEKRRLEEAEATYDQAKAGNHGTFCAARAAWGSAAIELVDVRLGFGHSAGNNNPKDWQDALTWALDADAKRCDIVSCSVLFPFDGKNAATGAVVSGRLPSALITAATHTLFLGTAGNAHKLVEDAKRGSEFAPSADNVILVGGCTGTGKLDTISAVGAVDVYAPNSYSCQYAPDSQLKGGGSANDQTAERTTDGLKLDPVDEFRSEEADSVMDYGVSFGLPMVANVAAKCKLINPYLTPAELKRIIVGTARETDRQTRTAKGGSAQSISVKMMDPVAAYNEAARLRRART